VRCPRCQAENREGRRFCVECGNNLLLICTACNFANEPEGKFCGGCGRPLAEPVPTTAQERSLQAYTPKHIATRILSSRHAMEGEHKQVTVLFCDLVESTRLAEQVTAEVMHQVMDQVLKLMAEAVHRHGGTVNQFLGDGMMALFGAPVAMENHALQAVHAALAIQETLSGYGTRLKQEHGFDVQLRMGLNTGPVVVGRIGDDLRMDYTAVGDTTNLAARLQAMAEPGTILISEASRRAVEGYVHTEGLGTVSIKGRRQPASIFRVTGRRRRRSRLEIRAEMGLTPLIGRERELALLRDGWERAKQGRGQAIGIVGEPGAGKSRLLLELRNALAGERLLWLEGHCSSLGQARPYLPILDIIRGRLQIDESDNPLQIEDKLRQGVRQFDAGSLPFLHEVFNLPGEDLALRYMDPQMKRRLTFDALRALTAAGARTVPLVLLFEDLHWVDKTSEDYLAFFVQGMAGLPVLLLATHRPGYVVRWAGTSYTQFALDLLTEGEATAMITKLAGTDDLPPEVVRGILEKAEGNPLGLEEITMSLFERGTLIRENGRVRSAPSVEIDFAATIQDAVRARIDRLDEAVKNTLQSAAAIGREFNVALVTRVSEAPDEIDRHLSILRALELIYDVRFVPELVSAFKHAVIQDVAYQNLLLPRRRALHSAIGEAVEELYPDQLEDYAAILAHHYRQSDRHDKVLRYAGIAGDRAARLYARAEAKTYYEQALASARALAAAPGIQGAEIDVAVKLASVSVTRADNERDLASLERARALAEGLDDKPRLAQVLYWLGRTHYVVGNTAKVISCAEQSLSVADRLGDEALAAPPVNLLGRAYWRTSLPRAVQMMTRSAEQMRRIGNTTEEATTRGFAGALLAITGDFEQAFSYLDQAIKLAQEAGNPFAEAANYFYRGAAHEQHGAPSQAILDYDAALRLAERAGDLFRIYAVKHYQVWPCIMVGDVVRARELAEQSIALAQRLGTTFSLGLANAYFAACQMAEGRPDEALSTCDEAIRLAEETQETFPRGLAYRTRAEALLRLSRPDAEGAERAIAESAHIFEDIGAKPEFARSLLTYARVLAAREDEAKSTAYLAQAVAMFKQMEMAWDLAQAAMQ